MHIHFVGSVDNRDDPDQTALLISCSRSLLSLLGVRLCVCVVHPLFVANASESLYSTIESLISNPSNPFSVLKDTGT